MDTGLISRRLKAGRWLAGGRNEKGTVTPLSPEELAQRDPLPSNRITANRIYEIEQERVMGGGPRPMELEKIALALGLSPSWFVQEGDTLTPSQLQAAAELLGLLPTLAGQARDPGQGPGQGAGDESGRPARGVEGHGG